MSEREREGGGTHLFVAISMLSISQSLKDPERYTSLPPPSQRNTNGISRSSGKNITQVVTRNFGVSTKLTSQLKDMEAFCCNKQPILD